MTRFPALAADPDALSGTLDERLPHPEHAASRAFARTRNVTRSLPSSTLSTTQQTAAKAHQKPVMCTPDVLADRYRPTRTTRRPAHVT
jgi:hypothetical protein